MIYPAAAFAEASVARETLGRREGLFNIEMKKPYYLTLRALRL
jgi:hypothetical protein